MTYSVDVKLYDTPYLSRNSAIAYRVYNNWSDTSPLYTGVVPNIYSHWINGYPDGIEGGQYRLEYEFVSNTTTNFNIGASNTWELWINGAKKSTYDGDLNLSDIFEGRGYFIKKGNNYVSGVVSDGVRVIKSPIQKDYLSVAIVPENEARMKSKQYKIAVSSIKVSLWSKYISTQEDYTVTIRKLYPTSTIEDTMTVSTQSTWQSFSKTTTIDDSTFMIELVFPATNNVAIWGVEVEVEDTIVNAGDTVKFVFYGDKKGEYFIALRREL